MATSTGIDIDFHRRLALECMAPGELRDDYLCYLDGLARAAQMEADLLPRKEPPPAAAAGNEAHRWTTQRYVVAALGSVAFATGAWLLTSVL